LGVKKEVSDCCFFSDAFGVGAIAVKMSPFGRDSPKCDTIANPSDLGKRGSQCVKLQWRVLSRRVEWRAPPTGQSQSYLIRASYFKSSAICRANFCSL